MPTKQITGQSYRVLLSGGLKRLAENCVRINKLNADQQLIILHIIHHTSAFSSADGEQQVFCSVPDHPFASQN